MVPALLAQAVSPALFNGLAWRMIGPFRAGRVVAVAGIPGDPTHFYFGAVGGGVWSTGDAGTVWKPLFDGLPVASIGALDISVSDPNIIYAGTGESDIRSDLSSGDGVYKSTDAGKTWKNVGLQDSKQISRIVIDPENPDLVYAGVLGHAYGPNDERGVYRSSNGGETWERVLSKGPDVGVSDLAIAMGKPKILFAGLWQARRPPWSTYAPLPGPDSGLYRSTNGGKSWAQLKGNGLPDGEWGRVGVTVSPDGRRVYALVEVNKIGAKKSGLYRSDDGGATWTQANADPRLTSRAWYFNSITIDPRNPDVFYVPNVALYRSEDAGKTISIVRGAPGGDDYHQLWVDPKNSAHMILGTDQGATISLDRGRTWSSWYNQPTAQFYHVITDDQFPYIVYGAQQDSGSAAVYSRTDHGQITARDWFPAGGSESGYLAPDPKDPNIVFESGSYGEVFRFNRQTALSQNVSPWPALSFGMEIAGRKYRATWTPVLLFSPFDRKTLYLGTQYVMKTLDGGLHWSKISPDLTGSTAQIGDKPAGPATVENSTQRGYGVVFTIAPSPLRGSEIWAGSDTGLIHLTVDGGKTWKDVTPKGLAAWSKITMIEASHFDPAVAYAAVDRHRMDDYKPYIFRTTDYGKTWEPVQNGIAAPAFLRAIREDPKRKGLLFAGTESGVFVSFDNGDDWQPLQLNLPAGSIRDLVIHGDDLVIGTHGRSFWILDDITTLRQIEPGSDTTTARLYRPATAVRIDNDSFPGTPLPPEEPTAKNPPDGAILDYYLAQTAGKVELDVLDRQQHVVRHFASGRNEELKYPPLPIAAEWLKQPEPLKSSAGMHRFLWDLRWGNSGESAGEDDDPASLLAPRGPRAVPGNYQVRLTADGKTFVQPLKLTMDPRAKVTAAVLDAQWRLVQQIFAESRRSHEAVTEIASVQKKLGDFRAGNHPELMPDVSKLTDAIKKLLAGEPGSPETPMGMAAANAGLSSALNVVEGGDRLPPSQAIDLYHQASQAAKARLAEWNNLKSGQLTPLNRRLRQANLSTIELP